MRVKDEHLKWWGLGALLVLALNVFLAVRAEAQDFQLMARRNVAVSSNWGRGSGFIYKRDTVLTAAHLLGPNMKVDGKNATPVYVDTNHDIMLLYTKTEQLPDLHFNLVPTPLMAVIAVGNPLDKRNFFSIGYVGYANANLVNTSNVVMHGYSGGAAYDRQGHLVGMVVAGEGNCTFGYTIDRLVAAKRLILFLFEKKSENINELLDREAASREAGNSDPNKCPNKTPQPVRPP